MTAQLLVLAFVFVVGLSVAAKSAEPRVRSVTEPVSLRGTAGASSDALAVESPSGSVTVTVRGLYMRHSSGYWHWRYAARTRQFQVARARTRHLTRELLNRWDYPNIISLAATAFRVDRTTLDRKARCESGNFTDFYNDSGASNVFQFLPSTWATTPFARFSIWNPFAAVLAGAWMHSVGRGGEWSCR